MVARLHLQALLINLLNNYEQKGQVETTKGTGYDSKRDRCGLAKGTELLSDPTLTKHDGTINEGEHRSQGELHGGFAPKPPHPI